MKKLAFMLLVLAGCFAAPEAEAQIRDTLFWVVAPFEAPGDTRRWWKGGDEALQADLVSALAEETRYEVYAGGKADDGGQRKATYTISGRVVQFGWTDNGVAAVVRAQVAEAATGKVVWRGSARYDLPHDEAEAFKGSDEELQAKAMFDKVMKPVVRELVASIKAADL